MHDYVTAVVSEFGTPCYIYDRQLIERNIRRFRDIAYPHKAIHGASMANNNPHLMGMMREAGLGIFVNSMKHLAVALHSGFAADEIGYTSTGIRREDLQYIIDRGISTNLDSLSQLRLFGELCPGGEVGVRLNIEENSLGNVFVGTESRIGIIETEFDEALELARTFRLRIRGTHVYLGTNIVSLETMLAGVERTLRLSERFPDLEYVDLGGGFPIDGVDGLHFDYEAYGVRIAQLFEAYSVTRGRPIRLILEPGRSLFGDTAAFCSRVLDVKERPDRTLVCCDASVSIFPRPMFYNEFHDVSVHGKESEPPSPKLVDVVGATTYSRDFLAKRVQLPPVEPGDLLVFANAGSYCYSMHTEFLGQTAPIEVLVGDDAPPVVIREREAVLA
jgi:diaminopimelate decarboxylase